MLDLKELGSRLAKVDHLLVNVLGMRMKLALQVGEYKTLKREPIYRAEVEENRLNQVGEWAKTQGLNPRFAQSVLYLAIDESCKVQMIRLQQEQENIGNAEKDGEAHYQELKEGLLRLTEKTALAYDDGYCTSYPATRLYLDFEDRLLADEIDLLDDKGFAVDIGCATGRKTIDLAGKFERVIGYDISPHMIERACARIGNMKLRGINFETLDVEGGLPERKNSASLVVMNFGTAGDLRNTKDVLREMERILRPGGKAFLSFYNRDALVYRLGFIPWTTGLAAEVNHARHCLDVHFCGEVFQIYAQAYSADEVNDLLPPGLQIIRRVTYPTLASLLPPEVFEQTSMLQMVDKVDTGLAEQETFGAYLLIVAKKAQ